MTQRYRARLFNAISSLPHRVYPGGEMPPHYLFVVEFSASLLGCFVVRRHPSTGVNPVGWRFFGRDSWWAWWSLFWWDVEASSDLQR